MSVLKIRFQSQTDRVRFSEGPKVYRSDRPIIQLRLVTIFSNVSKQFQALEPPNTDSRLQTDR